MVIPYHYQNGPMRIVFMNSLPEAVVVAILHPRVERFTRMVPLQVVASPLKWDQRNAPDRI